MVFYVNYKNFCDGFYWLFFFQQGNNTHTVLHIDNIELKHDFANLKSQIKLQSQYVKKIAIRYFPQIAQP